MSFVAPRQRIVAGRYRPRRKEGWVLWFALPLALMALLGLIIWIYQHERGAAWTNFSIREQELARLTSQAVDARLSAVAVAARMLSLSPSLRPGGDIGSWEQDARRTTQALGGWVVLCAMTPGPVRLADTLHPAGTPTPPFEPTARAIIERTHAQALATGQPVVSDQFIAPLTGKPAVMVSLATAATLDGAPRMIVDYVIDAGSLTGLLTPQHLGEQSQTTLRDGRDAVIATTRPHPTDPSRHAARWADPAHQGQSGVFQDTAATGMPSLYAYQRPEIAPRWRVVVVVPLLARTLLIGGPIWAPMLMAAVLPALLMLTLGVVVRHRRASRAALTQIEHVLAEVPAAIFVDEVHPDGRRRRHFISRSARQLRDGNWVDLPDDPALLARVLTPGNAGRFAAFRAEVLRTGRGNIEFTIPGPQGARHDFRTAESCFARRTDGSLLVVGCVTDITEANARRDRLQQAEKLAVLGEVATGIAHEMNQPLAAIAMAAENGARALGRTPANDARARAKFELIQAQVARITAVVNHISLFGRAGFPAPAPFSVDATLANALRLAAPRLAEQEISLQQEIDAELPQAFGVDLMLEQVLLNVLINAADAYRARQEPPGAEATARVLLVRASVTAADRLLITIADRAGGFEPGAMERLFDPVVSTRQADVKAGLGLSISFATVAEMGGQLRVRHQTGGAMFEIELPVHADGAPADEASADAGSADTTTDRGAPRRMSA